MNRYMHTVSRRHPRTLRLNEISYRIEVSTGGGRTQLFEYRVTIGNDIPNPTITHGIVDGTVDPSLVGQYLSRFDVPERVRTRRSRWRSGNGTGPVGIRAENWDLVNGDDVLGRNVADVQASGVLDEHYVIYQRTDGDWRIRRRERISDGNGGFEYVGDNVAQQLTVIDRDGVQVVDLWRP